MTLWLIGKKSTPPILQTGFRLFFLSSAIAAILGILLWMLIYSFGWAINIHLSSFIAWHAHEMIFGYAMAVIAGFLLTAVQNWTGLQTLRGVPLLSLFLLWFIARIMPFIDSFLSFLVMAVCDMLFISYLTYAVFIPIFKVKQWRNMVVVIKVFFILVSNLMFYLGEAGLILGGYRIGLYSAFYLIISLILMLGRRVLPFFIEKGVGYPVKLKNREWIDNLCIYLFLFFWGAIIINPNTYIIAILSGGLCILHIIRIVGWYTYGIWKKPLLWSIYLSYACIILGFALIVYMKVWPISIFLPLHAFAYGGIGVMTLSMMARVSLGHTGRSINHPSKYIKVAFICMLIGMIFRVIVPILSNHNYSTWIIISQILWIVSFSLYLIIYTPMLCCKRIDDQQG